MGVGVATGVDVDVGLGVAEAAGLGEVSGLLTPNTPLVSGSFDLDLAVQLGATNAPEYFMVPDQSFNSNSMLPSE